MAAAISSYLSACSASLAFWTSCSRSTILDVYVVVLCASELIKSYCVSMGNITVFALQLLTAVCATADGTPPPPPSDFPRLCHHPRGRYLARWRHGAGRSVADCRTHVSHSYDLCVQLLWNITTGKQNCGSRPAFGPRQQKGNFSLGLRLLA